MQRVLTLAFWPGLQVHVNDIEAELLVGVGGGDGQGTVEACRVVVGVTWRPDIAGLRPQHPLLAYV